MMDSIGTVPGVANLEAKRRRTGYPSFVAPGWPGARVAKVFEMPIVEQLRKCQQRLQELARRSDYLPLYCASYRGEGVGAFSGGPDPFAKTLAGSVRIPRICFSTTDGRFDLAFYTDVEGATEKLCAAVLDRVEAITNELVRILRGLPRFALECLNLPEGDNWWRKLFHLAWHFPRPFFRAFRMRLLTRDGDTYSPVDETCVQLYGYDGIDLFPGIIYSDFIDGHSAPDLCVSSEVAIDVVLDALKAEPTAAEIPRPLTAEERGAFRRLRQAFHAGSDVPAGWGVDLKLVRLDDSFATPPATEWAGLEFGGTTERTVMLSRRNAMKEICHIRGPSTIAFMELAEQAGNTIPFGFVPDLGCRKPHQDTPVLSWRPTLDKNGKITFIEGSPVGCGMSGVCVNPDPAARWLRFVFNVLKWHESPLLRLDWGKHQISGNALATLDSDIFAASVEAIDLAGVVPQLECVSKNGLNLLPTLAAADSNGVPNPKISASDCEVLSGPVIPVAKPGEIDLGTPKSLDEFREWCSQRYGDLRGLRTWVNTEGPSSEMPFLHEVVRQTRVLIAVFGGVEDKDVPDEFQFPWLSNPSKSPSVQENLQWIAGVERFLTWAVAYAGRQLRDVAAGAKREQPDKNKRPTTRRRQPPREPAPLTEKQIEAAQLVGEHKGNIAAAAQAAGISRQAMVKRYKKALTKLGRKNMKIVKTTTLRSDRRGQIDVADPNAEDPNAPEK